MRPLRIIRIAALTVGILLATVAGLAIAIDTAPGKRILLAQLADALAAQNLQLEIDGVSGSLWGELEIERLRLADAGGVLVSVDEVLFDWQPGRLLAGELRIATLSATGVDIARLPSSAPTDQIDDKSGGGLLPDLPVDLRIDRIAVDRLALGAAVVGAPAEFTLDAGATLEQGSRLALRLDAHRTDGDSEAARVDILLDLDANRLEAGARVDIPEGGALQRLIGLADGQSLTLTLDGDGPLDAWKGRLVLDGGDMLAADIDLAIAGSDPWRVTAGGTSTLAAFLPAEWRFAGEPALKFDADIRLEADGAIDIARLAVESDALAATLSGSRDADGTLDLAVFAATKEPAGWQQAVAPLGFERIAIDGTLTGSDAEPVLGATVRVDRPAVEQARADALTIDTQVALAEGIASFDVEGRIAALTTDNEATASLFAAAAGDAPAFSASGRYDMADGALELDHAHLGLAALELDADGTIVADPLAADFAVTGDISDLAVLAPFTGMDLAGAASLQGLVTTDASAIDATVTVSGTALSFGDPMLDGLAGGDLDLAAIVRLDGGRTLRIDDLSLDASGVTLDGAATADLEGGTIDATWHLALPSLVPVAPSLAGSLDASGTISGALADPDATAIVDLTGLAADGQALGRYRIEASLAHLATALRGKVTATGDTPMGPLELAADIARDGDRIAASRLDLRIGSHSRIRGDLSYPIDAGIADGMLDVRIDSLAPYGALAGTPLQGGFDGRIALDAADGAQRIAVDGTAASISSGDVTADTLALDLSVTLGDGAPRLAGAVDGSAIVAGPATLDRFSLDVESTGGGFRGEARAVGNLDGPLELATGFDVTTGEGGTTRIAVARLDGVARGEPVALERPVTIEIGDGTLALSDLALTFGPARIAGSAAQDAESVVANLTVSDLPVGWIGALADPGQKPVGTVDLTLALSGTPAAPVAIFGADIEGLAATAPRFRDQGTMSGRIDGRYESGRLTIDSSWSGLGDTPLEISAALPMNLSLDPFVADLPPQGALEGRAIWSGDVRFLLAIVPIDPHRLDGAVDIDLTLAGTVASPVVNGRIALADGRYENLSTGTLLDDLALDLNASGRNDLAFAMSATDGGGGTVSADGTLAVDPGRDMPFDVTASFANAVLVRRDEARVKATGDVHLTGTTVQAALTGDIAVDKIDGRIDTGLPPSITELDVTEINVPGAPVEQEPEPIDPGVPFALDLDVNVNIPNQAYLRGRGLDSEWQGKLHVTGTAAAPRIIGELSPRRGTFSFADKNFDITDSRIVFDGSPDNDPRLDISAVNDAGDLTAIIRVTGRASNPEIAITSRPPLPQDEIMSRLLFGRKAGQLSPIEAFQLAQALRSLTGEGGGGGIVDIVRQTIGVDVLAVGSDAEGGATLEVGQYLTEGVRVGVEQRFETGSTAATVEIELTDEISIETEVGGEGSKVGVSWGYDY